MWDCPKCGRAFQREKQLHSCKTVPLEEHFENKEKAKELFDLLNSKINKYIGSTKKVSLPCCIHLFGKYDFLAALPKKDRLEIRFALPRVLKDKALIQFVAVSEKYFKNCIDLKDKKDINSKLIFWLNEAYFLKS